GLDPLPADVDEGARCLATFGARDRGLPEHPCRYAGELRLLARVVAHEVERAGAIEAHLRTLVGRDHPSCPAIDPTRVLRRRRRPWNARDVVDPLAVLEHPQGG